MAEQKQPFGQDKPSIVNSTAAYTGATAEERRKYNNVIGVFAAVVVMGWVMMGIYSLLVPTTTEPSNQAARNAVGAAADEVERAHTERLADQVSASTNEKLAELGWYCTSSARTAKSVRVHLTAPALMSELEAKEVALTVLPHFVAALKSGTEVRVTVKSPAGQDLATASDRAR